MNISIVVPAFNEERGLAASLRSIRGATAAFDEAGWSSELIVCDNNSTDRTAAIARAAGARVVFEPKNQIARARNTGAAHASGDWLLFIDADCSPSRELFEDVLAAIETGRCLGGGATIVVPGARFSVRAWVAMWNALSRVTSWAAGSFIFCETRAWRELGGFSEALYAAEEIEFSRRLKRLARRKNLEFVILHRHALRTSGRKAELYSWREHAAFLLRVLLTGGRVLRRRERCAIWYDGRR